MEGSVVWLYCRVNSISPSLRVTWSKDSDPLVQDVPHVRMRRSTSDAVSSTFFLIVDIFTSSDTGTYQCTAQQQGQTARGSSLILTGLLSRFKADASTCYLYSISLGHWIFAFRFQYCKKQLFLLPESSWTYRRRYRSHFLPNQSRRYFRHYKFHSPHCDLVERWDAC